MKIIENNKIWYRGGITLLGILSEVMLEIMPIHWEDLDSSL